MGEFHVAEVTPSPFMCSNILTGKGGLKDSASLSDIFGQMSASRLSHAKGFDGKADFDYSLKWTIAVSRIDKRLVLPIAVPDKDMEKYRANLIKVGASLLAEYTSDDINHAKDPVTLENLFFFDLNHDGQPEISAKIRKTIQTKTAKGSEQYSTDAVYLNLWVTYNNGSPQVILSLISYEREGSWGRGHDLVGTLDVDGDGIEEVIIGRSGWEVVDFEIYEYQKDKLERVFRGAGFGC